MNGMGESRCISSGSSVLDTGPEFEQGIIQIRTIPDSMDSLEGEELLFLIAVMQDIKEDEGRNIEQRRIAGNIESAAKKELKRRR